MTEIALMKVNDTKTNARFPINVTNERELKKWMNYFRCSRNELILAIKKAGPFDDQVGPWLNNHLRGWSVCGSND